MQCKTRNNKLKILKFACRKYRLHAWRNSILYLIQKYYRLLLSIYHKHSTYALALNYVATALWFSSSCCLIFYHVYSKELKGIKCANQQLWGGNTCLVTQQCPNLGILSKGAGHGRKPPRLVYIIIYPSCALIHSSVLSQFSLLANIPHVVSR